MTIKNNQELENWIYQINDQDMPIFAATVSKVTSSLNSDETSASDVAESVLSDASLTSNVLKMANTIYYNPGRYKITTITRAVMILGFERIRSLVLSFSLIDSLRHDINKEELAKEMAYSFHAAVQAKELANLSGHQSPEDIFIATLLSHLGELVFWSFSEEKGVELCRLMKEEGLSQKEAEYRLLGFHLSDLTKGLTAAWSLGELLEQAVNDGNHKNESVELIHMGQEIAHVTRQGWNSDAIEEIVRNISKKLKQPENIVKDLVRSSAKLAKNISSSYGLIQASNLIPQPQDGTMIEGKEVIASDSELFDDIAQSEQHDLSKREDINEVDYATQLAVLQEITEAIEEKPDMHVIIKMVLEGICRGLAMDRALFAMLSEDRKSLVFRYAIGKGAASFKKQQLDISHKGHIFNTLIQHKKGMLIPNDPKSLAGKVNKQMLDILGYPPYVMMPTIVKNEVIGLFLADRGESKRKINEQDFLSYQGFCQQANMGLTFLAIQD